MAASKSLHFSIESEAIFTKYGKSDELQKYLALLESENEKLNLVSRETSPHDLKRLTAESLIPFEKMARTLFQNYLDIGSGGGLPAIPIMISLQPENSTLIERTQKKAAALRRILTGLGLNADVVDQTFEECDFKMQFDLITLRLVRLSKNLLAHISESLTPSGVFVCYAPFEKDSISTNLIHITYSYSTGENNPVKSFTIFTKAD